MKCPKCQTELPETANFCFKCGQRLNVGEQPPKLSTIPEAERKHVTALFSDLSGYTSMTEKLDPEEVKEITGRIFDGVKAVVNKYEGFIERFAGDGVMALFGVPRAHEDDPIRAIRAAREIHAHVEALSPRYEIKVGRALSMHSGINTGLVVTADVDPEKGTHSVTGEAINVASRLSDLAGARDILVGPDTYRASQSHFTFQPLKPTKVKGKLEHIPIYKVLSEKAATARVSQEMQVLSEMVGRDQELAKLELHILKAVNGQGSVVNVFGEPGVGKSRLLAELGQREVIRRVSFLEGRSISIGKNLSFHPIIDLYKQWARIKEDDTQTEASNRLETAIRRVCGDETDEVFPFVATMMGMKLSGKHSQRVEGIEGEALEKLILKNVRELLIRSTELIPIVIVMEDLHWADTTSLELLESLFRLAQTHRVVFINVFRPGYWQGVDRKVETLPEWLPEADFAEIAIKPLDRQTGEALVNNMLQVKGLRHALKKQIVDRAGGNPFFMEEIVRSLIDEGAIVRTNGTFHVTEKIDHVVIPTTINDVLTARIDRLEEQTRDLIKVASVIGRSFFDRILKEVADSIEGVDERLTYLKDAQFIHDRIRMEELEYLFKHVLAQEAAYESTLIQQRKRLHRKVAQSIEKVFRERLHEFYGMLVYHYSNADDLDKAENYMIKAGEEALKSSASSEALYYYQNAMELYIKKFDQAADPNKMSELDENIGFAFFNRGYYEEAIQYLTRALFSSGIKEPKSRIHIIFRLVFSLFALMKNLYLPSIRKKKTPSFFDNRIVRIALQRGKALAIVDKKRMFIESILLAGRIFKADISKSQLYFDSLCGMSALFSYTGISFRIAKKLLDYAMKSLKNEGTTISLHFYKYMETIYDCLVGNWHRKLDKNAIDHALKIGDLNAVSIHLLYFNIMRSETGEFKTCERIIDRLRNIVENFDHDYALYTLLVMKTRYLSQKRELVDTLELANEAIGLAEKMGIEIIELSVLGPKLKAQVMLDELDSAKKTVEIGETVLRDLYHVPPLYVGQFYTGRFLYDMAIFEKSTVLNKKQDSSTLRRAALTSGRKALSNSKMVAERRTEVYRLKGKYYWLVNKDKKALKWWSKSISEGTRLGARPELARTYMEVGKRLSESKSQYKELNGISENEYLNKARSMFKEMDLQWDLDELERISATN